jgi:AsmA family protein
MRSRTVLKAVAVIAVAMLVALIAVVKTIDFDRYKGFLAAQVEAATGRKLTIAGPLTLELGLSPRVTVSGVSLANPPGASRPEMITVGRIEAQVALLPLLSRQVVVRRLVLIDPDIRLETDKSGQGNWQFQGGGAPAAAAVERPAEGSPPTRFDVGEVTIRNAHLAWRMPGAIGNLGIASLKVQPNGPADALTFQVNGDYMGNAFDLGGRFGSLAKVDGQHPWPVQVKATLAGAVLTAEGTIAAPFEGKGLDLAVRAQGDDVSRLLTVAGVTVDGRPVASVGPFKLAAHVSDPGGKPALDAIDVAVGRRDALLLTVKGAVADATAAKGLDLAIGAESDTLAGLSALAGSPVPPIGPLKLSAHLADSGSQAWALTDIKGKLGGSDLAGALSLSLAGKAGGRPVLSGHLNSDVFSLADFTTPAAKPGEKAPPAPHVAAPPADGRIFPNDPLPLSALDSLDATLSWTVGKLDLASGMTLNAVSVQAKLDHGHLSLAPLSARLAGGTIAATLGLDKGAKGKTAALSATVSANGVSLGSVVAAAGGGDALSGAPTAVALDLKGNGGSVRALMASLSGSVLIDVGAGTLRSAAIDWGTGDVLSRVLTAVLPGVKGSQTSALSCAVAHFRVENGVARAEKGLAMESDTSNAQGGGTIDLRSETLDLGMQPQARGGVGISVGGTLGSLIRLQGTLASPQIGFDELGTAKAALSAGAAVATGGLSILGQMLADKVTGEDHPCQIARGGAASSRQPARRRHK